MKTNKISLRSTPLHVALGAALLGMLVTPLAMAGADDKPVASAAKVTDAKFKKLKQRIAKLEQSFGQPSGPAGGDLLGTYPDPRIAPNALGTEEIIDESVTFQDIGSNAVGSDELINNSVTAPKIGQDSVGAFGLKGVIARVGSGVGSNGNFVNAIVTCQPGEMVIGGGYAWANGDQTGTDITASAPDDPQTGNPNTTWVVRGRAPSSNTLFAWANCLQV